MNSSDLRKETKQSPKPKLSPFFYHSYSITECGKVVLKSGRKLGGSYLVQPVLFPPRLGFPSLSLSHPTKRMVIKNMTGNHRYCYTMTKTVFNRILCREGKVPMCENCEKKLLPGIKVLSKLRVKKLKTSHSKRYCEPCRRLLGIWVE